MDKLFDDEDLLINPPETKVKSLTKQKSFEVSKNKDMCICCSILKTTKHLKMLKFKKGYENPDVISLQSAAEVVAAEIAAISSSAQLSSREKNRAIRKAKMLAKQRSKEASKEGDSVQGSFNNSVR